MLQLWTCAPVQVLAANAASRGDAASAEASQRSAPTATAPSSSQPRAATPARVVVNRTPPRVTPPPATPTFSAQPTDKELTEARVFGEPLVRVGRATLPSENRALARIIEGYLAGANPEAVLPFWRFIEQYPDTPWRASLLLNLGIVYRRTGYYSRALDAWEAGWALTRTRVEPVAKSIADRTVGELFEMHARLGRFDRLETLSGEVEGRAIAGRATEQITAAKEGLWMMRNHPEQAFRCGPLAIDQILVATRQEYRRDARIIDSKSTLKGTSLAQVRELAASLDLTMRMAHRSAGAPIVMPAVVHWRAGHFAAIIREEAGRYLVRDPTFGDETWVTRAAFDDEATGYMLIAQADLPQGWRPVEDAEGGEVWGKGLTDGNNPPETCTTGDCEMTCPAGDGSGMPSYSAHLMVVSLNLRDTPVGYTTTRGPNVYFTITYNQREAYQPQLPTFTHLGPKWMANWISYVEDDPAAPSATAHVQLRGGGRESFQGFNPTTQSYAPGAVTRAVLVRTSSSPIRYERRLPDGSLEVFAQPDGSMTVPRRIFMTESRDAAGNAVTLAYDGQLRLVSLSDAIGQVTTLTYDDPADARRVTRVTDPFSRFATYSYDGNGRLAQITDVLGLQTTFTYDAGDFITSMTTPYGISRFRKGEDGQSRWLEMVDPLGATERLEYQRQASIAQTEAQVPTGTPLQLTNAHLQYRNTFYWTKLAMARAPRDLASAHIYHWLHTGGPLNQTSGVLESERPPLESRIWYLYPGQTSSIYDGTSRLASATARVLDDGSSQIRLDSYNTLGNHTAHTDPLGRRTSFTYAANGIDLLEVRQTTGVLNDLLRSYSSYTALHVPQTMTDAAGQSSSLTYDAAGNVLTFTNPKNETTTYSYDAVTGSLLSITNPVAGATTTYTYDAYGRLATITDEDSYTRTYEYDVFDRLTRVTYPDASYEQIVYDRLDISQVRDRLGRWTRFFHDALQRIVGIRDPLGRLISPEWCGCGSLTGLVDAKGQKTKWELDLQGRVTRELRGTGGSSATTYAYEARTSRLKTITDPRLQATTFNYNVDDTLQSSVYTNAQIATPTVSYTYDAAYNRVATRVDGTGTTAYTYRSLGTLGARRIATVDGPLANDTLTYGYDQIGRVSSVAVDGVASSWTYDALGRVDVETNVLGAFTYAYDGATDRLASLTYPNGQTTTATYFNNNGDRRLQTLNHQRSGGATLSKFDYTFDKVGNVLTWQQQADSDPATRWVYAYDAANQLLSAVRSTTGVTPTLLKRYSYTYDLAGNRTTEQIDDVARTTTHDSLNRMLQQSPGGSLRITGTVNEPATVSIQGRAAAVDAANGFSGALSQGAGTTTFSIQATDASGNSSSASYEVDALGSTTSYTFDASGNLTSDGTQSYEWDALSHLVAINKGTHRSEFTYDGLDRRVRIVEKDSGVTTRDARLIWAGSVISEERLSTGEVTRFFAHGEQHNGTARYLTRDHLGSVREVTDASGTVLTRNDYDPYGRLTRVVGTEDSRFGYTGHMLHAPSGLVLARFRGYDPALGRWLSDDPAGMIDGPNRFAYVTNRPITAYDPDGLFVIVIIIPAVVEAAATAALFVVATITAAKTGQAISDAIQSRSQRQADEARQRREEANENTREQKFNEQNKNDKVKDQDKKEDPHNRKKFPKEQRPEDRADDLEATREGFRKGGRDQVDSSRKTNDKVGQNPNDPDRRCP